MPSEATVTRSAPGLPDPLRGHADAFHSQLALASEELRDWHVHHEAAVADPAGVLAGELGSFAEGRVDTTRLAGLVGVDEAPDPLLHQLMALAEEGFDAFVRQGDAVFRVELPRGGDLRDAVRDALANLGRAFALARAVEKARSHRFDPDRDHELLRPWPFHRWSPAEKDMAPPLVIDLEGADLRAVGLAEFLEGRFRTVLRVRGDTLAAPLARLASPGVFVAQVVRAGDEALTALADYDGPGVVAVFEADAGALAFTYRPDGTVEVDGDALNAASEDAESRRGTPGLVDLRSLRAAAARPAGGVMPAASAASPEAAGSAASDGGAATSEVPTLTAGASTSEADAATPEVDRLAGWLLSQLPAEPDEG